MLRHAPRAIAFATLFMGMLTPSLLFAETIELGPDDDLAAAMSELAPGDEVVLAEGEYSVGGGLDVSLEGTVGERITVRNAVGARPRLVADSGDGVLRLTGAFFTISGLEIAGPGTGLTLDAERALIQRMSFTGGTAGIGCTRCVQIAVLDSEFTAIDGDAAMRLAGTRDSTFDHNWLHDLPGTTDGIRIAAPAAGNVVVDNVVESVGGIGIAVGDDPVGQVPNAVLANWVSDSGGHGIQLVGRAQVVNNVVLRAGASGLFGRLGTEGEADISVFHNTVVGSTEPCFRAEDWALSSGEVALANNALYCADGDAIRFDDGGGLADITGNVYVGVADRPGDSLMGNGLPDFADAAADDYYPAADSPLLEIANPAYDVVEDFNGSARDAAAPDAGAYERVAEANPVPMPGGGFKPDSMGMPGDAVDADAGGEPDAGPGGSDAGGDGGTRRGPIANAGGATGFDREEEGCQCASSGGVPTTALLFGFLVLLLRRRRR